MRTLTFLCALLFMASFNSAFGQALQSAELENGSIFGPYAGPIDSPFNGVATYANDDGVDSELSLSGIPGRFRLDITGASSHTSSAGIAVYLAGNKLGDITFAGTQSAVQSLEFNLAQSPANSTLRLILESDDGSNDTLLDKFSLHRIGDIPPAPDAPLLPSAGSYESGVYRNMFAELGYSQAEITAKLNAAYNQLFHSANQDLESGQAIFIDDGSNGAYIWDTGNDDVRSEGLSYGMMIAVQMDRQDDFNKIWKWAYEKTLNTDGDMKGYFGWRHGTDGSRIDAGPAPDGEEYFVTALFFAAHRWGNGSGIYNYTQQANNILDDMFGNGQTRYDNQGQLEEFSLFNHAEKQVVFSPATPTDRNWTDPSYHLPAFYELWARWADNNKQFWADLATTSRAFFKTTVHPTTALNPDYAYFDGRPYADFGPQHQYFEYDAWRTSGNIGLDFAWFNADPWATDFAKRLHNFFDAQGVTTHGSRFELNGTVRDTGHSPGLVAMNAVAALASDDATAFKFVQELWDTSIPSGRYRYYDGCLYLFGMLAMSGQYRIYCPNGECDIIDDGSGGGDNGGGNNPDRIAIPGTVEAEDFVRQNGIQTENTADTGGGQNIGYIQNGDHSEYELDVTQTGRYRVTARVASNTSGGTIRLVLNDQTEIGSLTVNSTGGWQDWQSVSTEVDLNQGNQTLKLNFSGGSGYLFNINWLDFQPDSGDGGDDNGGGNNGNPATCEFIVTNDWNTGFTGNIKVTNQSSTTITDDWSVSWTYSDGSTMFNGWNANFSGSNPYTATPLPWNAQLAPGQSVEFGVQNNKGTAGNPVPAVVVSGDICQ